MACMEHECLECGWAAFDNAPSRGACPKCGGRVRSFFDEADDYRREAAERDEPEDYGEDDRADA